MRLLKVAALCFSLISANSLAFANGFNGWNLEMDELLSRGAGRDAHICSEFAQKVKSGFYDGKVQDLIFDQSTLRSKSFFGSDCATLLDDLALNTAKEYWSSLPITEQEAVIRNFIKKMMEGKGYLQGMTGGTITSKSFKEAIERFTQITKQKNDIYAEAEALDFLQGPSITYWSIQTAYGSFTEGQSDSRAYKLLAAVKKPTFDAIIYPLISYIGVNSPYKLYLSAISHRIQTKEFSRDELLNAVPRIIEKLKRLYTRESSNYGRDLSNSLLKEAQAFVRNTLPPLAIDRYFVFRNAKVLVEAMELGFVADRSLLKNDSNPSCATPFEK